MPILTLACLTACQATRQQNALTDVPAPAVSVVARPEPGARLSARVSAGLPDEAAWRALGTWWREALSQTTRFSIAPKSDESLPTICLTVSTGTRTITASLYNADDETVIASVSYGRDSDTPGLLAAVDQLAWATRRALGEAAARPMPVESITSRDPEAVIAAADAAELIRTGGFNAAYEALRVARRRDGGAPYLLAPLASLELLRGDAKRARDISREALGYTARCSPTIQHRLARTLLLAKSALDPRQTAQNDRELKRLAQVARRERPHDDEPRYTAALAHNFLAEFTASRPLLEGLYRRLPERGFIAYHLGWACLGTDDPGAAADCLHEANRRLPTPWLLLPWCIALFEAQRHDELSALLRVAKRDFGASAGLRHQVIRMQAAQAILTRDLDAARALLLEDLQWLAQRPTELDQHAGDFAEEGAVLVRLGSDAALTALVAAVQQLPVEAATRDAAAFVGGMHQVQRTGRRARALEETLARDGDSAWGALLRGYAHERAGEVGAMQQQLARAALLSSSPLTKALLARSLREVGKQTEADLLNTALRREMLAIDLRAACEHPIFGPELAYAYSLQ